MGKSPQKTSLGFKILAWSFVPTAIILLLVALTAYYAYQRQTEQIAINQGGEVNRLSASEVSSGFEDFIDRLTILARDPSVYYGLIAQQQMALNSSSNRLILFDGGVFILDNLGKVIAASIDRKDIIGKDWSNRTFFLSMVRSPGIFFTNIEPYGVDGSDVIAIAVPILGSQNDFRGIVVGMFRLDASTVNPFYGTILKMRIGEVGNAYLVDGNQRIIFSSDFKQNGSQLTDPKMTSLLSGGVGSIERITTADGKEVLLGYDPVPRTSWSLITAEDWSVMVRPSERYRTLLIALLILGVIVPTGFVMVGVRRITRPVDDFIAAAQRIASGDFSQPIQLNTNDEMEELAEQFNRMAEKLQESYDTLEQRVEQRTHELTAVNTVSAVVSRSLDLDRILADALDKTLEVMGMEAGVVYRLDVEMKTLQLVAQRGVDELSIKIFQYVPVTISVVQEVLETQLPMAFTIDDYPPGPLRESLAAAGIKTVVSIPLVAQDQMLGAMNVATREDFHLSFEALSVAAAIGQQIGVAIDNARLYEQSVAYAQDAEKARQEADRARLAAEAANAAKSDFLANVSHELRTPLASILGFARLVQKRLEERIQPVLPAKDPRIQHAAEQMTENLDIILAEGQRLTSLINDLLDLEKIEAGQMVWHMAPVAIPAILQQAYETTQSLFEGREVRLVVLPFPDLPMVTGDSNRLLQVVINLISNASKFTKRGEVTLSAQQTGDEVWVSVRDQGIGIDPADQEMIFEKFRQVGDTLTEKPSGTGLGLAICKQIVEHHGGCIWVVSELGNGSTFTFSLPIPKDALVEDVGLEKELPTERG